MTQESTCLQTVNTLSTASKTFVDQHDILKAIDFRQLEKAAEAIEAVRANLLEVTNLDNLIRDTAGMSMEENDMQQTRVKIGYTEDGKPVYKHLEARTMDEMHDKIAAAYFTSGRYLEFIGEKCREKTKFKPYAEQWLKRLERKKKTSDTIKTYRSVLNAHILPAFGECFIEDITWEDIQEWLDERADRAKNSVKLYLTVIAAILEKAKENKLIDANPAKSSELVIEATKETRREALTPEQQRSIAESMEKLNPQEQCMIALYMTTGIRKGELLGLEWSAIDFEKGKVHILQQSDYRDGGKIKPPKRGSKGSVDMSEWTREILLKHRKESGYVLEGRTQGKPLAATSYERRLKEIKKKVDLFGASGHVFRHTAITTVYHDGADEKTLQAFARHKNISTTLNIYVDPLEEKLKYSATAFDRLLNKDAKSA